MGNLLARTEIGAVAPVIPRRRRGAVSRPVDFESLLGPTHWASLPLAVRQRFSLNAIAHPHSYQGAMEVRASAYGYFLAQVCRLFGTPLAPWRSRLTQVRVDVRQEANGALTWDRTYAFRGRPQVLVSSRKEVDGHGRLMEVVRGGLGMRLDLTAVNGALHFRSKGYFLRVIGVRIPLPMLLTPGKALIIHEDRGAGWFRFSLRFVHPWAGETIFQTGLFRDPY